MGPLFSWIIGGLTFALRQGKPIYEIGKKIVSLPFYRATTARGKFIAAGGSLAVTGYFSADQYESILHLVVDKDSPHTFKHEMARWVKGDQSLAQSGKNYMTGYGAAMLIHIGMTAIELIPVARAIKMGVKNPLHLLYTAKIRRKFFVHVKYMSFTDIEKLLSHPRYKMGIFDKLPINLSVVEQKILFRDMKAYFNKLKNGTPKKGAGGGAAPTGTFSEVVAIVGRNKVKSATTVAGLVSTFTLFLTIWLEENELESKVLNSIPVRTRPSIPDHSSKIERMYKLCADNYNRFYQNPLMSSDIRNFAMLHKVKTNEGFSVYVELQLLGKDVIELWYKTSDFTKPLYGAYLFLVLKDLIAILDGVIINKSLVPEMVRAILESIKNHEPGLFIKLLTIGMISNNNNNSHIYTGLASGSTPAKELLDGFGNTRQIVHVLNSGSSSASNSSSNINPNVGTIPSTDRTPANRSTAIEEEPIMGASFQNPSDDVEFLVDNGEIDDSIKRILMNKGMHQGAPS